MRKIKKIEVSTGIIWVEIQEIGLYMLCGVPANAIKHLAKKGLINIIEQNGIKYESGPNVILLSDLMIQNGELSNLAEFPVLQMLYKQGMIIPNHPNNTGKKPILIGDKEQLRAQMEYIFRGNYGLVDINELKEAGFSDDYLKDYMNMKLNFAFGKIKKSDELLQIIELDYDEVEIFGEAFIKRVDLNLFELRYKDEKIDINLNLERFKRYETPYQLNYHLIDRDYFGVIHSGEADGWDINHPCMASILMFQGKIYLIDAGPNLLDTLIALGISVEEIEGFFHTHAHDDHFASITTLMKSDHKIKYYASKPVRVSVAKKLSALIDMKEDDFFDFFDVIDLKLNEWNDINGLEVMPIISPHPIETNIFYFRTLANDGYKIYAHLADIVSFDVLSKMVSRRDDDNGISKHFFEEIKKSYLIYADLKKIDCGGGMIHGVASDFVDDNSKKLVISHIQGELDSIQKEIGSGAPFGTVDTLIPAYVDYLRDFAKSYLLSYFPNISESKLNILLNNKIVTINPESIIVKDGEITNFVYLILSGNCEVVYTKDSFYSNISAGALIGDNFGEPIYGTHRAIGFVRALKIPIKQFMIFIKENGLSEIFFSMKDKRDYFKKSWLFGEFISFITYNKITSMTKEELLEDKKSYIYKNTDSLHILKSGLLYRYFGDILIGVIKPGDFFGEESAIFKESSLYHIVSNGNSIIYSIPGDFLINIPIVRWKLLEIYKKRKGKRT